jgi:microcystin-dependent protein
MNKKLSQLTEKLTSLGANDLILVTSGGVSKSVKVSTLEAPLKTYADNKASEAQAAAISAATSTTVTAVNSETARATSVESGLQNLITQEIQARITLSGRVDQLESSLQDQINLLNHPGMLQMYAGSTAPNGWLICDVSAVSRTQFSELFAVIGTSYGAGNGSTTFNLPDPDGNVNIKFIIKV